MATVPYGSWQQSGQTSGSRRRWLKLAAVAVVGGASAWMLVPGEPVAETGLAGVVSQAAATSAKPLEAVQGVAALNRCRELLGTAEKKLAGIPTMSAVFQKQERVEGDLKPLSIMDLKVRHEPLSVYMKWQQPDAGQELIWREGAFDGKIVVCPAGWRRKVMPMVKVDPHGDMAMAVSRRPITNIGIWNFNKRLLETVNGDLTRDLSLQVSQSEGDEISGRPVYRFTFEHAQPSGQSPVQKMVIFYDRTLEVPVAFELYVWSTGGGAPKGQLEESYIFRDLKLDVPLSESDFDHQNPAYAFTAK